jgi:hypothetical protein
MPLLGFEIDSIGNLAADVSGSAVRIDSARAGRRLAVLRQSEQSVKEVRCSDVES